MRSNRNYLAGGEWYILIGSILLGLGIGMAEGSAGAGIVIGAGAGFLGMVIVPALFL